MESKVSQYSLAKYVTLGVISDGLGVITLNILQICLRLKSHDICLCVLHEKFLKEFHFFL